MYIKIETIMKKIFLSFAAMVMAAGILSAQDINAVTEIYNNGAMELDMGNKEVALEHFQNALTAAEALGDEGADIVANCQTYIPAIMIQIAKGQLKENALDEAIETLGKAVEAGNTFGNPDVVAEATSLTSQAYLAKGNNALNAKDFETAVSAYQIVLAENPANGLAQLRLGMALGALGKMDEAEAAYLLAAENGQQKGAFKQLSNIYVKYAQAANKAKNFQEAYDLALKSNEYLENANACRIAAGAAQQLKKNDECIAFYEKYIALKPNAKDAGGVKFTIAALYQQAGNKEKAKEYYQMVAGDPQYGPSAAEQLKNL